MVLLDEVKRRLSELQPEVADLADALAIERSKLRLEELENKSADPAFYDDAANSGKVFAEMGEIKEKLESYRQLQELCSDAETLLEMCAEDGTDEAMAEEAQQTVDTLAEKVEEMRLVTLLTGEYDANNAILTFHAGAGGTEAQDWAEMLLRMYTRFGARHGWNVKTLDYLDGDEGRRHTSFASLEVMPEMDDKITVEIRPEDIKMEVFRSSGAGGQHINKTSSAVRLIHIPTGIVVSCQNERSQFQNRDMCMKMLAAKLYQIKEREHLDKISDIKGVQKEIAWGSQIRSYVFMPYTLVKDHRTGFENGNVDAVMDGDLDGFINAYLKAASKGELAK